MCLFIWLYSSGDQVWCKFLYPGSIVSLKRGRICWVLDVTVTRPLSFQETTLFLAKPIYCALLKSNEQKWSFTSLLLIFKIPNQSALTVPVALMLWSFRAFIRNKEENQLPKNTSLLLQSFISDTQSITERAQRFPDALFCQLYLEPHYRSIKYVENHHRSTWQKFCSQNGQFLFKWFACCHFFPM